MTGVNRSGSSRWFDRTLKSGVNRLPPLVRREINYARNYKRLGHLQHPVLFSEKVNWRILNDRRPLLAWTCDKVRMKEEAARCGVSSAETYWSGQDLTELANVRLPEDWVLKPNHRCGLVYFGHGPIVDGDFPALEAKTRGWLQEKQARVLGEWAYSQARPCLLVEEMLGDRQTPPHDYKFFVFDGQPCLIHVHTDRWPVHRARVYTPTWEPQPFPCGYAALGPIEDPPEALHEMLLVAARLAKPFDFMRIDLYAVGHHIYLGEYTPYPNGGMRPYWPRSVDQKMGAVWRLPALQ